MVHVRHWNAVALTTSVPKAQIEVDVKMRMTSCTMADHTHYSLKDQPQANTRKRTDEWNAEIKLQPRNRTRLTSLRLGTR